MRRLVVALACVALLAALVPSITLAARPPAYRITSMVAVSNGVVPGYTYCQVEVRVYFRQADPSSLSYVGYAQYQNGVANSYPRQYDSAWVKARGGMLATQVFNDVQLMNGTWQWVASLRDGADGLVGTEVLTSVYTGSRTSCPAAGTVLASAPKTRTVS